MKTKLPSSKLILLSIMSIALLAGTSIETPEQKGFAIAKKTFDNTSGYGAYSASMTMTLKMDNGKSFSRKVRTLSMETPSDLEYTITIFESPSDVKGTKLLLHGHKDANDDQWIYLPALNKSKRIANENKSGAFMGSEVAFEDMGNSFLYKNNHVFVKDEVYKGQDCYVIKSTPKSKYSGYSYIENIVNKISGMPMEAKYYDKKGELVKVGNMEYSQFNKCWIITKLEMRNVKNSRVTIMLWNNFDFNAKMDAAAFSPDNFSTIE